MSESYSFDFYVMARPDDFGDALLWAVYLGHPRNQALIGVRESRAEAVERALLAARRARAEGLACCVNEQTEFGWRIVRE